MKSIKPLTLSIVIPAYNEEHHLVACLEAIAAQTTKPDEVLIVDNNSTDKTVEIASRYSFARVLHEKKQGVVYARNRGFNTASSVIIGRIDADTVLPKNWVEQRINYYQIPKHLTYAWTGGCYFYNIRLPHVWGWFQGQIAFRWNRVLLGHYILFGSNMALPKVLWLGVRHDVCLRNDVHEDLDLSIHLHRKHCPITYQDGAKVGVKMRRVRSDRSALWDNLMLWPVTIRAHHIRTWYIGWLGALVLYVISPLGPFLERVARMFRRPPLEE